MSINRSFPCTLFTARLFPPPIHTGRGSWVGLQLSFPGTTPVDRSPHSSMTTGWGKTSDYDPRLSPWRKDAIILLAMFNARKKNRYNFPFTCLSASWRQNLCHIILLLAYYFLNYFFMHLANKCHFPSKPHLKKYI